MHATLEKNEDKADDINTRTRTYINETQNLGDTYIHKYNIIILNGTQISQCHSILSSVFG